MNYLLDTNIISAMMRDPQGAIAAQAASIDPEHIATSAVCVCELWYGVHRRNSVRLAEQLEAILGALKVFPFETPAERIYGRLRAALEGDGAPIGAFDTLIAAHALALDHTLVTDNIREFGRIPGLKVENWLR